jgi:hypothetical protein
MRPTRLILLVLTILSAALAACDTLATETRFSVKADEVAVVYSQGLGALEDTLYEGDYEINPLQQGVVFYPLFWQVYTFRDGQMLNDSGIGGDAIEATTTDGATVRVSLSLVFSINADEIDVVFDSWGTEDYRTGYIRPTARRVVRELISPLSADDLRSLPELELQQQIEVFLRAEFEANGFLLQRVDVLGVGIGEG